MEHQADRLMQAMNETLPSHYAGPMDFPMKTVAQACRHVLLHVASGRDVEIGTSPEAWRLAVENCGHRALMALVSATAALRGASRREVSHA